MQSFHFDTVDSTNEAAKRLIHGGELRESAYLLAREQTAGRGSRGRSWASPKNAGIYLSVVEFPREPFTAPTTTFTLAAAVACVEALAESAGLTVRLKPVNDLFAEGGKLGGILTETIIGSGGLEALITGVGINVRRADRPVADGAASPVCIEELLPPERFAELDLDALVASLVTRLHAWNAVVLAGRAAQVEAAWERHKLSGARLPTH